MHPRLPPVRATVLLVLSLAVAACSPDLSPEDTVKAWFDAVACGDAGAALPLLDESSRAALDELAQRWSKAEEGLVSALGTPPADPDARAFLQALFTSKGRLPDMPFDHEERVGQAHISGDHAEVPVRGITETHALILRRDSGRWRLVLKLL